ncbi:PQ loop repeat protein-like protein [Lepidopterella palustris CBS 459.81]|uniref:PQ loop repeat protein-like protein n=1 Tax=Lepidopterella palustris CBS 459.81 TaxID=1314670 RepID=A0A8E2E7S7_9PEZI|nr:PQ loop repeat protein-like protein [Lepidopterella palustris CBS 459.81]
MKDRCKEIASPDISNFVVSIIIVLGILVSYLPQHYRIISRKSSRGISPMFVLLGTVSGTAAIANILTLPASRTDMGCCKDISPFACTAALLGIAQVGVQWTCFFFIMLLFLIFFPRRTEQDEDEEDFPTWIEAIIVLSVSMAFFIAVFIGSVVFIYAQPNHLQGWANFLGIVGTILASIQYIPQIWTTWKLQDVMSLSIPMMCIQTPGSFVFAASLAARLGIEGWSAWGLYCVSGTLQGALLVMGISFWLRDRRQMKNNLEIGANGNSPNGHHGANSGNSPSEQTPLLTESGVRH